MNVIQKLELGIIIMALLGQVVIGFAGLAPISLIFFWSSTVGAAWGLLLALLWDYERRRGNILFEEISNETQWHLVQGQSDGASAYHSPADERPAMETRIIMRQFVAACEWPLVPGRYGGTVYAGLCLLLLVGPLILTRF